MTSLNGNWIDLLIIIVLLAYVLEGLRRGFFVLVADLISFLASLVFSLRFYPVAAKFLIANFSLNRGIANAIGFVVLAITVF